jgi:hypothetical protein
MDEASHGPVPLEAAWFAGIAAPVGPGLEAWATLTRDLADRYHVHLDGLDPRRGLRFVAVARSLDVRPYAIVTSDPDELREALAGRDGRPGPAEECGGAPR